MELTIESYRCSCLIRVQIAPPKDAILIQRQLAYFRPDHDSQHDGDDYSEDFVLPTQLIRSDSKERLKMS